MPKIRYCIWIMLFAETMKDSKLSFPTGLAQRLKEANSKGLSGEAYKSYLTSKDDPNAGVLLPTDIKEEMIHNNIPEDLCNFVFDFYLALRQDSSTPMKPLQLLQSLKNGRLMVPKTMGEMKDLITIFKCMEEHLKQHKRYKLRMNQIAALVVLLFGTSKVRQF